MINCSERLWILNCRYVIGGKGRSDGTVDGVGIRSTVPLASRIEEVLSPLLVPGFVPGTAHSSDLRKPMAGKGYQLSCTFKGSSRGITPPTLGTAVCNVSLKPHGNYPQRSEEDGSLVACKYSNIIDFSINTGFRSRKASGFRIRACLMSIYQLTLALETGRRDRGSS
jgi:hypothetical protein